MRTRTTLANAELAVMELLWDEGRPLTARDVRERLYPGAEKAQHGTVQRLIQRLEDKGYVVRDGTTPVNLFSAAITRDDYASDELESARPAPDRGLARTPRDPSPRAGPPVPGRDRASPPDP